MSDTGGAPTMSQREYARHVGVDVALVNRWLRQGKIPRAADGRINPVVADAARKATADPRMIGVRIANEERRRAKAAAKLAAAPKGNAMLGGTTEAAAIPPGPASGGTVPAEEPPAEPEGPRYIDVQTERVGFAAKREQLRYEQEAGRLCEVEKVTRAIAAAATSTQTILRQMPNRIASRLAAETDTRKIHQLLDIEIEAVCHEIARTTRAIAAP